MAVCLTNALKISSPCIGRCELDDTAQTCLGCGRSLDDIARWSEASDDEKVLILDRLSKI